MRESPLVLVLEKGIQDFLITAIQNMITLATQPKDLLSQRNVQVGQIIVPHETIRGGPAFLSWLMQLFREFAMVLAGTEDLRLLKKPALRRCPNPCISACWQAASLSIPWNEGMRTGLMTMLPANWLKFMVYKAIARVTDEFH